MIPAPTSKKGDEGKLLKLVQMGLQKEKLDRGEVLSVSYSMDDKEGSEFTEAKVRGLDLDSQTTFVRRYPNYTTKFITTHKNAVRCAKFSPDGNYVATGSADTSIKLLDVQKMKTYNQLKETAEEFGSAKPVTRTFYDHTQGINDVDFHPGLPILASCSRDCTIKFFDYGQPNVKRSFRFITDTENVRTINFHPGGEFLLAGTDHPMIRLYDINTFQCYTCSRAQDHHLGPINQVRYAPEGNIYASCSKDGSIKLWDAVTNKVINTISNAHNGREPTCVQFSRNQKYLLSAGKDGTIRIWELSSGRQIQHIVTSPQWENRLQVTFSFNEDFVISADEKTYAAIVWDTRTGEVIQRLTGHTNIIPWIASSPTEPAIMTCSADHRARFWVEDNPPSE